MELRNLSLVWTGRGSQAILSISPVVTAPKGGSYPDLDLSVLECVFRSREGCATCAYILL